MARQFSAMVLCPNGRRETVKISPNNSILQVLEDACVKQNLNPQDFDLWHYKKPLDLSLPIRFANLPNNALLEIHPAKNPRKDSMITIALQLESGERVMKDFTPSATLLDVLKQCLKTDNLYLEEKGEPVCIYMRQKITGEDLNTATLRSLGLTQGTAIIRLLYRKPEELESQAHISSPLTVPVPVSSLDEPQLPTTTYTENSQNCNSTDNKIESTMKIESMSGTAGQTGNSMDIELNENKFSQVEQTNLLVSSSNEKELLDLKDGCFSIDSEKMDCDLNIKKECVEMDNENYKNETENVQCDFEEEPEEIGNINYIGERHAVLYSLDDITNVKKADLPDEFFELTISDVRYLMEGYKTERISLENQPLLTKEQRERQLLQKLEQYSKTVIRIYFPEKLVLQAVFLVTESVQTVCDFLQNYLDNKELSFYLYTTPPKEKLNKNKTLLESMLVPAAVVYFGCDIQFSSYLEQNLQDKKSDPRAAALAASEARKVYSSNIQLNTPSQTECVPVKSENIPTSADECPQSDRNSIPKSAKVPKWMKLSKK